MAVKGKWAQGIEPRNFRWVIKGSLARTSASVSAWLAFRAMLGDAAWWPAVSHHDRNARSSATDGATIPRMSNPCSTASGSIATVVNGVAPDGCAPTS